MDCLVALRACFIPPYRTGPLEAVQEGPRRAEALGRRTEPTARTGRPCVTHRLRLYEELLRTQTHEDERRNTSPEIRGPLQGFGAVLYFPGYLISSSEGCQGTREGVADMFGLSVATVHLPACLRRRVSPSGLCHRRPPRIRAS